MFAAWLRGGLRKIRIHHNHLTQIHRSRPRRPRRRFCFILFPFSFSSPCSVLYWQPATNIEIKCLFCILFWRMASAKIIYAASGVSFACATPMPPWKEEIVQPTYLPTSVSFSSSLWAACQPEANDSDGNNNQWNPQKYAKSIYIWLGKNYTFPCK